MKFHKLDGYFECAKFKIVQRTQHKIAVPDNNKILKSPREIKKFMVLFTIISETVSMHGKLTFWNNIQGTPSLMDHKHLFSL